MDSSLLFLLAEGNINTEFGEFRIASFYDGRNEATALYRGGIEGQKSVLCRLHSACITAEAFHSVSCECDLQLRNAQKDIEREGSGIIIYLNNHQGRGNGIASYLFTLNLKEKGISQSEAYKMAGFPSDSRSYDIAAKILKYFKIISVRLTTNNKIKIKALEDRGIGVERIDYSNHVIPVDRIKNILDYNKIGQGLSPLHRKNDEKRILIIGDLAADYMITAANSITDGDTILNLPQLSVGGTAYNAALEFSKIDLRPVIVSKLGDDTTGRMITAKLEEQKIVSFIEVTKTKHTAFCILIYDGKNRILVKDDTIPGNTNDYDLKNLGMFMETNTITGNDCIFMAAHFLSRCTLEHSRKLMEAAASTGAKIILDLVPHNLYTKISIVDFNSIMRGINFEILIGEYKTFMGLLGKNPDNTEPTDDDIRYIIRSFNARIINIRYGKSNVSEQLTCVCDKDRSKLRIMEKGSTGWDEHRLDKQRAFGDKLTAELVKKYIVSDITI